ncbi:hypothetical protein ACWERJ_29585, partial [Streptomyces sp. NPDC004050]
PGTHTGGGAGTDPVIDAAAAAAARAGAAPAPAPAPEPEVQPGMWLAAFQGGLTGESSSRTVAGRSGAASQNTDASPSPASKGEQP